MNAPDPARGSAPFRTAFGPVSKSGTPLRPTFYVPVSADCALNALAWAVEVAFPHGRTQIVQGAACGACAEAYVTVTHECGDEVEVDRWYAAACPVPVSETVVGPRAEVTR